jgi:uncharacterized membrane protein YbhN (UPF0104 family)
VTEREKAEDERPIRRAVEVSDAAVPAKKRGIVGQLVLLAFTAIGFYVVWPSLLETFSAWPDLLEVRPVWFVLMFGLELASFVSFWYLLRLVLHTTEWFGIATSQVAGNAFSRIVPGGAVAGAALQMRMLVSAGFDPTRCASALTAVSLLTTATVFAMPALAFPAIIGGAPAREGLAQAAWIGVGVSVVLVAIGAMLLLTDAPLRKFGRGIQRVRNLFRKDHPEPEALEASLIEERRFLLSQLGSRWWEALLSSVGKWTFDYLALLAGLAAVGAHPRPSLVLLAFVGASVLSMIPITPGGLGFVEAGLTGLLTLAGIPAGAATLATLAYRLFSYWLPILAGLVAAQLHARRYGAI